MSEDRSLTPDETDLVGALAELHPAPLEMSEQQLWYEAGLRTGRRRARIWGGVAAAVALIAAAVVIIRPTVYIDRVVVQGMQVQPSSAPTVIATATENSTASIPMDYVRLRDAVERQGLDALNEPRGGGTMSQPAPRALSPRDSETMPSPWDSINTKG